MGIVGIVLIIIVLVTMVTVAIIYNTRKLDPNNPFRELLEERISRERQYTTNYSPYMVDSWRFRMPNIAKDIGLRSLINHLGKAIGEELRFPDLAWPESYHYSEGGDSCFFFVSWGFKDISNGDYYYYVEVVIGFDETITFKGKDSWQVSVSRLEWHVDRRALAKALQAAYSNPKTERYYESPGSD